MSEVLVPPVRWARWVENFERGHGASAYDVEGGALHGRAEDGSTFTARLPFEVAYQGEAEPAALGEAVWVPNRWGVLLVRRGGFAMARVEDGATVASKVGQRHVQGRTKAGGQSQQRFARRRDNQAQAAYDAAAGHALTVLGERPITVVVGGDRAAVAEVLAEPRLAGVRVVEPWLAVPDPRRAVLDRAMLDAASLRIEVVNA